jgi:hypothetical protein|tara:strand:- start:286 stop:543 length:258 start_codon:yes stop_codon:yes gene_type:complete
MIYLYFKSGGEYATLIIDREKKRLRVNSSKTGYKTVETEWSQLYDSGKEKEQEKIIDKLDDRQFKKVIELSMNKVGYILDTNIKC